MPTVPTYDSAQVMPGAGAAPYRQPASIDTQFGARQLGAAGEGMQRLGAVLTQEEVNVQGMANQVRVDAALNAVRQKQLALTYDTENGYINKKGAAALDPDPLGRSLPQQFGEQLGETISSTAAALGNDAQRRVFNEHAAALATQFGGSVQGHMLQEFRTFGLETQQGTVKLAADTAKLNWNAPDQIGEQIKSAEAAVWKAGQLKGEPANLVSAKIKETTSAIHAGVIAAALQNDNPEYALAYIEKNKAGMTADDLLRARGVVNKDVYQRIADGVATNAVSALRPKIQPTDADRVINITMQSESGGRETNAAGATLTSPKGAKGIMQVMDGTVKDPGYGVAPAADGTPAERARVGRDYMMAMVKNYGGDTAKAWAAYNWGPGNLDAAIKEHGEDWLAHTPAETRAYVAKNVAALVANGGAPAKPTLLQVHDDVRARITERFGATPPAGVLKLALAAATQQFEDINKATKAAEDENTVAAMRALQQNGGRVSALPFDVRSRIPADKLDNVISFGQKVAKGDDITNPAVYQRLSDPDALRKLSDNEFYQLRTELSDSDFKHFAAQRAPKGKIDEVNMSAMNSALRNRMQSLGMDPTPKDGSDEASRLGAIKKYITDTMLGNQKATGKQMTDADVEKHIDGLFAKTATFRTSFLGISTGATSQRLLTMKASDIPDDTREKLMADFKAHGIEAPTDGDLLGAYLKLKSLPQVAPSRPGSGKIKTVQQARLEADTRAFLQGL